MATVVQDLTVTTISGSGDTATITGVAAGNSILIGLVSGASGSRSFAPTSDLDGAMTVSVDDDSGTSRTCAVFALHDASAGNHTFDFGWIGGVSNNVKIIEVSGLDPLGAHLWRQYLEPSSTNSHVMVDPIDLLDTVGAAFFFGVVSLNSSTGDQTALGGYTELSTSNNQFYWQYKEESGAISNENGAWQGSGTARAGNSTLVAFPLAAVGGALNLQRMSQVNIALPFLRTGIVPGA